MSQTISRRKLLKLLVGLGIGTDLAAGYARRHDSLRQDIRPNILLFLTDDQAWNAVGYANHYPFLKTPHIDTLALEGARFENAFVTTSLCSPNRATLLTGCYAHRHGVRHNETTDPDESLLTFPQVLRDRGYDTAFIGKWHMALSAQPRPGFDYWLGFRRQGEYDAPTLNENGREFKRQGYITDILTEYALRWWMKHTERVHSPSRRAHKEFNLESEITRRRVQLFTANH